MLLTITLTAAPATDLGYLLHKHPDRLHTTELSFGSAHVFYPEATEERCTAALLLEIDPVELVRGRGRRKEGEAGLLAQYVNDRPYVASSFMSVALAKVFGTALGGRSKERPELAAAELPFEVDIPVLPCRGGEPVLRRLFEPLGYELEAEQHPLDPKFPDWGLSRLFSVRLKKRAQLCHLLAHLYVLIPVLDDEKHYWVGDEEIEKLLRQGQDWLSEHPDKELIVTRYLRHQRPLANDALARLSDEDQRENPEEISEPKVAETKLDAELALNEQRMNAVLALLVESNARSVVDLGCGEGKLLRMLLRLKQFARIAGMDVSHRALEIAADRLNLERLPDRQREILTLFQGSLIYRDERLKGYDAATLVEVVEHLDPARLESLERVVFAHARPGTVIVTTPNREYNQLFDRLTTDSLRHGDHRFEWTRSEFAEWTRRVATEHGYQVRTGQIGPEHPDFGTPTQMAVFTQ